MTLPQLLSVTLGCAIGVVIGGAIAITVMAGWCLLGIKDMVVYAGKRTHGAWTRWRVRGWRNRMLRRFHRKPRVLCEPTIPPRAEGIPSADIVAAVRRKAGA